MGIADELEKLEQLRTRGTLTDEEFALAKARLLNPETLAVPNETGAILKNQLDEIQHQNQLARFDREWDVEQRRYQLRGPYGRPYTPSMTMGIVVAVSGMLFGLLWIATSYYMPSIISAISPVNLHFTTVNNTIYAIGVVIAAGSLLRGIFHCIKAVVYQHAYHEYLRKRQKIAENLP